LNPVGATTTEDGTDVDRAVAFHAQLAIAVAQPINELKPFMLPQRGFAGPMIAERVHLIPDRHKLVKILWKETKISPA